MPIEDQTEPDLSDYTHRTPVFGLSREEPADLSCLPQTSQADHQRLIEALLEELEIEFHNIGSTTLRSPAMAKGIEPDQCFYIAHGPMIRGKRTIDLAVRHRTWRWRSTS